MFDVALMAESALRPIDCEAWLRLAAKLGKTCEMSRTYPTPERTFAENETAISLIVPNPMRRSGTATMFDTRNANVEHGRHDFAPLV